MTDYKTYNDEQVQFQTKRNVFWSSVFYDYEDNLIGAPSPTTEVAVITWGYSNTKSYFNGKSEIEFYEHQIKEFILFCIAKFWEKDLTDLWQNTKIYDELSNVKIFEKDTNNVIYWEHGQYSFAAPIIFEE